MTAAFSSLLFANVIDNVVKHVRTLFLGFECFTGVWLFFVGYALIVDYWRVEGGGEPGAGKSAMRVNFFLVSVL
jgi:hypothetical protein